MPEAFWHGAALWLVLLVWLCRPGLGREDRSIWRVIKLISLGVILLVAWLAVSWLQAGSPWHVLLLIFIISAADIGAFFTGKHLAEQKLAPQDQPGQRPGPVSLAGWWPQSSLRRWRRSGYRTARLKPVTAGLIALGLATISIGGDLLISLLKPPSPAQGHLRPSAGSRRRAPDRFDSLGAAIAVFCPGDRAAGPIEPNTKSPLPIQYAEPFVGLADGCFEGLNTDLWKSLARSSG